ncbi:Mitochondrial carrier like protein 2 [Dufourea novaeangliae]|uniref:Mitochondrial carrier like protein 2 n=1 Tax=Dufourea novaeangliae TaxID=178035 RepID=A0A154NYU7_DUFNO|nr:Mitochondrial carrier like protein 2 [Dufourea novaeangliae]
MIPSNEEQIPFGISGRVLLNFISHPFEYAKVLIQIGHEPILPRPTTTFFRQPALALPNVFQYVKHIKSIDGIPGCYRGVIPKMCAFTVSSIAFDKTSNCVKKVIDKMEEESKDSTRDQSEEDQKCKIFIYDLIRDLISRMVAIIVSHPLDVIAVRMMAQFVGKETQYNGLFRSVVEVYKENGITGYYAGVVPRLIGNAAAIILFSTSSYVIDKYILNDEESKPYVDTVIRVSELITRMLYVQGNKIIHHCLLHILSQFITTTVTYPFLVVSHCMAVNDCGLAAGLPPHMPIYNDWKDCWSQLSATNQLRRGNTLLWRYYSGQQIIINGKPTHLLH